MNNTDKKAKWENVKEDPAALQFHAARFMIGQRDQLAVFAYQFLQHKEQEIAKKND